MPCVKTRCTRRDPRGRLLAQGCGFLCCLVDVSSSSFPFSSKLAAERRLLQLCRDMDQLASRCGLEYFVQWVRQRYLDIQLTQIGRSLSESSGGSARNLGRAPNNPALTLKAPKRFNAQNM